MTINHRQSSLQQKKESFQKPQRKAPSMRTAEALAQYAESLVIQRAMAEPGMMMPADVQALQRTVGNRAVGCLIQPRLMVGPVGDRYEREADRVAEQVMSMPVRAGDYAAVQRQEEEEELQMQPLAASIIPLAQRQEEEEELQMQPLVQRQANGGFQASGDLEQRLAAQKGAGSPLPDETRTFMEPRFGVDFSGVRVHTDSKAVQMNQELRAQAFTHGHDIFWGAGKYNPDSSAGKRLLAHELTHVVQQRGAGTLRRKGSKADLQVRETLPSNRISLKKKTMHLDFVRMKRLQATIGTIVLNALGLSKKKGTYGHWWTEIGDLHGKDASAPFTVQESYGWWPKHGAGGIKATFKGVPGALNALGPSSKKDPHQGEKAEAVFHPVMTVDDQEPYDQIRDRVVKDIRSFAQGYKGKWAWRFGWGKNCHTFQQKMKKQLNMHYKKSKHWLLDPDAIEMEGPAAVIQEFTVPGPQYLGAFTADGTSAGTIRPGTKIGVTGVQKGDMVEYEADGVRYWLHHRLFEMTMGFKYPTTGSTASAEEPEQTTQPEVKAPVIQTFPIPPGKYLPAYGADGSYQGAVRGTTVGVTGIQRGDNVECDNKGARFWVNAAAFEAVMGVKYPTVGGTPSTEEPEPTPEPVEEQTSEQGVGSTPESQPTEPSTSSVALPEAKSVHTLQSPLMVTTGFGRQAQIEAGKKIMVISAVGPEEIYVESARPGNIRGTTNVAVFNAAVGIDEQVSEQFQEQTAEQGVESTPESQPTEPSTSSVALPEAKSVHTLQSPLMVTAGFGRQAQIEAGKMILVISVAGPEEIRVESARPGPIRGITNVAAFNTAVGIS